MGSVFGSALWFPLVCISETPEQPPLQKKKKMHEPAPSGTYSRAVAGSFIRSATGKPNIHHHYELVPWHTVGTWVNFFILMFLKMSQEMWLVWCKFIAGMNYVFYTQQHLALWHLVQVLKTYQQFWGLVECFTPPFLLMKKGYVCLTFLPFALKKSAIPWVLESICGAK